MTRYRATIAYVGTAFHGWQRQTNAPRTVQALLERALGRLPIRFRAPLVLAVMEERSHEEIGALLGIRVATVKTRLFRARRRLRMELAPYVLPEVER